MLKRITSPVFVNSGKRPNSAPPKILEVPPETTDQAAREPRIEVRPRSLPQLKGLVPCSIPLTVDHKLLLCIQLRQFRWVAAAQAYFSMQDELDTLTMYRGVGYNEQQFVLQAAISAVRLLRKDSGMIQYIVLKTCLQWRRESQLLFESGHKQNEHVELDHCCSMLLNEGKLTAVIASMHQTAARDQLDALVSACLRKTVSTIAKNNWGVCAYYVSTLNARSQSPVDYLVFFPHYMNRQIMDMFNPLAWTLQQKNLCCVVDLFSLIAMPANKFFSLYYPDQYEKKSDGCSATSVQLKRP
jgi:hypothetical protein